jgi:hypothetical protein
MRRCSSAEQVNQAVFLDRQALDESFSSVSESSSSQSVKNSSVKQIQKKFARPKKIKGH